MEWLRLILSRLAYPRPPATAGVAKCSQAQALRHGRVTMRNENSISVTMSNHMSNGICVMNWLINWVMHDLHNFGRDSDALSATLASCTQKCQLLKWHCLSTRMEEMVIRGQLEPRNHRARVITHNDHDHYSESHPSLPWRIVTHYYASSIMHDYTSLRGILLILCQKSVFANPLPQKPIKNAA